MDDIFQGAFNSILSGDNARSLANLMESRTLMKPAPANSGGVLNDAMSQIGGSSNAINFGAGSVSGGISYSNPTPSGGGGFQFDLPLATVQSFTNQAYGFAAQNTQQAQGFVGGVISNQQAQVTSTIGQGYAFNESLISQANQMNLDLIKHNENLMQRRRGSGCFITTAICHESGLADDCEYLQTFRKFRDEHVPADEVARYYYVAPAIVDAIEKSPGKSAILAYLRDSYLMPAFEAIQAGDNEKARQIYRSMVFVASVLI